MYGTYQRFEYNTCPISFPVGNSFVKERNNMTNTKARNAELASVARAIAERHPEHVYQGGKLLPLAKEMMAVTGCSVDTAKRHIAKQLRLMRGELLKTDARGGAREGAGFPEGVKRAVDCTCEDCARSLRDGGYVLLGDKEE